MQPCNHDLVMPATTMPFSDSKTVFHISCGSTGADTQYPAHRNLVRQWSRQMQSKQAGTVWQIACWPLMPEYIPPGYCALMPVTQGNAFADVVPQARGLTCTSAIFQMLHGQLSGCATPQHTQAACTETPCSIHSANDTVVSMERMAGAMNVQQLRCCSYCCYP